MKYYLHFTNGEIEADYGRVEIRTQVPQFLLMFINHENQSSLNGGYSDVVHVKASKLQKKTC